MGPTATRHQPMHAGKVALGGLLIAVSCVVAVEAGVVAARTPLAVAALAAIGLSVGSLVADATRA